MINSALGGSSLWASAELVFRPWAELNHFRIYEIAQSGTGEPLELAREGDYVVCLGFDTSRRCFVEINALGGGDSERFLERAAAVASQPHPALATVVDSGIEEGVSFYAADVVDGEALESYSNRVKAVPYEAANAWLFQIAEGAAVLAEEGLHPSIGSARLAVDTDGVITARIVDFGIVFDRDEDIVFGDRLANLLKQLTNYQPTGEDPVYPPEVNSVCAELAGETDAERCAEALGASGATVAPHLGETMRPRLLLEKEMFRRERPEHVLPQRLRPLRRAGEVSPYESIVEDAEGGSRSRILVLPPARFVSEHFLEIYEEASADEVLKVASFWKHDDFRLLAEELASGFSLAEWISTKGGRPGIQVVSVLAAVDAAIEKLAGAGVRPRALAAEDILVEFEDLDDDDAFALRAGGAWPPYRVRVRTHPTMRSLSAWGADTIPDGAEDVLRTAGEGGELPAGEVFAWYLNLRNRGLGYQAGELLESLREAVRANGGTEPVAEAPPVAEPLGHLVESSEAEEEEGDSEEPVIGPIAAAMGIVGDSVDDEVMNVGLDERPAEVPANPIAQSVALGVDHREPDGRDDDEEEDDYGFDDVDEEVPAVSPFADLEARNVDDDVPRDVDELLGESDYQEAQGRGASLLLLFFILVISVAIAAAIAHISGNAFWQQQ